MERRIGKKCSSVTVARTVVAILRLMMTGKIVTSACLYITRRNYLLTIRIQEKITMINYLEEYQQLYQSIQDCLNLDPDQWTDKQVIDEIALVLDIFKELIPNE